jgi:hypothetical protein
MKLHRRRGISMSAPNPNISQVVSWFPSLKVYGGGATGVLAAIIVWLLHQYAHVDLPDPIPQGLPLLIGFVAAYFLPHTTGAPGTPQLPGPSGVPPIQP